MLDLSQDVVFNAKFQMFLTAHPAGIQTSQDAHFYAASAHFEPFSNEGNTLVVQFTVKHEQKIDCGGGYVKIFPSDLDQSNMHGESQYYIMFGESHVSCRGSDGQQKRGRTSAFTCLKYDHQGHLSVMLDEGHSANLYDLQDLTSADTAQKRVM